MSQLTSDSRLIDLQHHFRISAGPGAGKTHWLIEHVKNVLRRSENLHRTRKIACITYTNIAVETILGRLNNATDHVEVSTFHSFLYRHIVKPYIHNLGVEYNVNVSKVDGHDEMRISLGKVKEWIENHPNRRSLRHPFTVNQLTKRPNNLHAVRNWLQSMKCQIKSDSAGVEFVCDRSKAFTDIDSDRTQINFETLEKLETDFLDFKKIYWSRGVLHHDDILFFSYKIVDKYPFVVKVLRNKFPYFFVDEFQDSNPIQVQILKAIGESETVVGIIGDKAQSIFEFQGADPGQFFDFDLEGIRDYRMIVNRRSTKSIISCLNSIRSDISQKAYRSKVGMTPEIIVGEDIQALNKVNEICNEDEVYLLTRKNVTANALKQDLSSLPYTSGMLEELRSNDSNRFRSGVIVSCIKAVELARNKKSKEAIKELERYYRKKKNKDYSKGIAIEKIMTMLRNYERFRNRSLYDFYSCIKQKIYPDIAKLTNRGSIKSYYENKNYKEFAVSVTINDDKSFCKTIHNAKGDEFENVLLALEKEQDLLFFLENDLENSEEDRIKYVAISRAKNRLFISVPTMSTLLYRQLKDQFKITYL